MKVFVFSSLMMAYCWQTARLPGRGETLEASGLSIEPGGKGLNVAVGLSRLGATVDAMLGVGTDSGQASLREILVAEGISGTHTHAFPTPSGHGAGITSAGGDNLICVFYGANALLDENHARQAESAIAAADFVYGQFETSQTALWEGFRLAKQYGGTTVLNPSPWQAVSTESLALCDIIIVNEVEAASLLEQELSASDGANEAFLARLEQAAGELFDRWPGKMLVVTLGEFGALAFERQKAPVRSVAFQVEVCDTVGAGDAFAAGLLWRLGQAENLSESLAFANACGGLLVANNGVLNNLPTAEKVAGFMARTPRRAR